MLKDVVSMEEATKDYIKQCEMFGEGIKMNFSDELLMQLEKD